MCDSFDTFLRKIVRDTLSFDQVSVEVVPDNFGLPFEFVAVDASTIRIAADDRYIGINSSFHQRVGFVPSVPARFSGLFMVGLQAQGMVQFQKFRTDGGRYDPSRLERRRLLPHRVPR